VHGRGLCQERHPYRRQRHRAADRAGYSGFAVQGALRRFVSPWREPSGFHHHNNQEKTMSSPQDDQQSPADPQRRTVLKGMGVGAAVAGAGLPGVMLAQGGDDYGPAGISAEGYKVTDGYFGKPYIDQDEFRDKPSPHRFIHGGFENTDTRLAFYFPKLSSYRGRMFQPLEGGHGGNEVTFGGGMLGQMFQRIALSERLGGYMVESNQGHIGDNVDPRAGDAPGLYGWRASAESARFSKFIAAQVCGKAPHHAYIYGGSGGGRRSPMCLENAPDVYDGCMPSTS